MSRVAQPTQQIVFVKVFEPDVNFLRIQCTSPSSSSKLLKNMNNGWDCVDEPPHLHTVRIKRSSDHKVHLFGCAVLSVLARLFRSIRELRTSERLRK